MLAPKSIYKYVVHIACMKKSVFLLALLLVACAPTTQQQQPADFRYGTEGLSVRFMPNLPPPEIFENEQINVMLQVENKGTYSISPNEAEIYLSGFDKTIIPNMKAQTGAEYAALPALFGRGPYTAQGGIDAVQFSGGPVTLKGQLIDKYTPTILATTCYKYETIASAQVCIDPKPFVPGSQAKVCTPSFVSTGSQGAPVAVAGVDVKPTPRSTQFVIQIANVGTGDVFDVNRRRECSPFVGLLGFQELNLVRLKDVKISGRSIKQSCKPFADTGRDYIRLINNQATIYCEFGTEQAGTSVYLAPLNVELEYGYRQTISTQVMVRSIG